MKKSVRIKARESSGPAAAVKRGTPLLIVWILLAVAVLALLTILFYRSLEREIYRERAAYLKEISEQITTTTDTISTAQWDLAAIFSTQLQSMPLASFEGLTGFLGQEEHAFSQEEEGLSLLVFDDQGHYYNSAGRQEALPGELTAQTGAGSDRQVVITTLQSTPSTTDEMVFVLRLARPVVVGGSGVTLTHVAVARDMALFDQTFQVPVFSGQGENYIVRADGARVYHGQEASGAMDNSRNVLAPLRDYRFLYGSSYSALQDAVAAGESYSLVFADAAGKRYYATSAPLNSNGWVLLSFVPEDVVSADMQQFMRKTLLGMGTIAAVAIASVSIVMYMGVRCRASQKFMRQQEQSNLLLEQAVRTAEEASQAKTVFLSHMSHDIRTPINGIMGMTDIARRNMQDPARVSDCLGKIAASTQHLLRLVNNVLDMSRIESGKIELEDEVFHLKDVLEGCCSVVSGQCFEKKLRLEKKFTDIHSPYLRGDALHLRQIIINLLSNAIKFTPEGGVIVFTARQMARHNGTVGLYLAIRDNGIGMSEAFQKKIFEPFAQEDGKARSQYHGTGLGMSIVRQLVDLMDGEIEVQSAQGHGSTFTVSLRLPVGEAPETKEAEPEETNCSGLDQVRILLVEDNALNLEIAQYILEECGAVVTSAGNGREALDLFRQQPENSFDVILMDIMMPVMDGLEATRCIRRCDKGDAASIPIVAMTANAYARDRRAVMEAGMDHYLSKPIQREKLIALLETLTKGPTQAVRTPDVPQT
ncbi:ATP-binding protein [Eubacterium sp. 1001713B170207_170306_E7]|uniref:ATP-binding protein n=1 Tax=Eubacterium sp. 1001713B170207_170306_E7 TaxID=2787097 RepID=UPI00189B549B|nr:ATP-binding protein [Eubacterium sp. 1001713B170207_170306_E7]